MDLEKLRNNIYFKIFILFPVSILIGLFVSFVGLGILRFFNAVLPFVLRMPIGDYSLYDISKVLVWFFTFLYGFYKSFKILTMPAERFAYYFRFFRIGMKDK